MSYLPDINPNSEPDPAAWENAIATRETLASHPQISTMIFHVLEVAQAGGFDSKRAEKLYYEIMDCYGSLDGEAFWTFRDEIIRLLVTPDKMLRPEGTKQ